MGNFQLYPRFMECISYHCSINYQNTLGIGMILGIIGMIFYFGNQASNQRKEEKQIFDRRWIGWILLACFFFYIIVFHYLANLPLTQEPLYIIEQYKNNHIDLYQYKNDSGCKDFYYLVFLLVLVLICYARNTPDFRQQ